MKPTTFPEVNCVFGKNQPQYVSLPTFRNLEDGECTFCWKLSFKEKMKLLFTGKIWHIVLTFNQSLQPQLLTVDKPFTYKK